MNITRHQSNPWIYNHGFTPFVCVWIKISGYSITLFCRCRQILYDNDPYTNPTIEIITNFQSAVEISKFLILIIDLSFFQLFKFSS